MTMTCAVSPPGYRIGAVLGHGRRSVVYLARDLRSGRSVALKTARRAHLQSLGGPQDFRTDFALLSSLEDPSIVQVCGHGTWDDKAFLAMEHAQAGPLALRVYTPAEAAVVLAQAARALALFHSHGWVHRDVKPANLLVRSDGSVALADVGCARKHGAIDQLPAGTVTGTPRYAAPEQSEGAAADPSADVYSLGVVLWQMLCGAPPFPGESTGELLAQHLLAPVPELPRHLAGWQRLLDAMLAKHPRQRPADGAAVLEQLRHMQRSNLLPQGHVRPAGAREPS
jgi:serine/threonine protein kinase